MQQQIQNSMETKYLEWDESRENDKAYLAEYYQSVADKWKDKSTGKKVFQRFQKAADRLKKELTAKA